MPNKVLRTHREMEGGGKNSQVLSLPLSSARTPMQGASAPPHPANPSLAGSGPVGGIPATPEPWLPRGRRSGAGEGREEGTRLRAGGGRSRRGPAQDEGGSRGRGGALRRGVGCCAGVPFAARTCRWRRLAGAGVRDAAQGMGGHNWPRSPLLCIIVDSSYFLFGGLGERKKKKSSMEAGGVGGGEPESRGG